MSPGRYRFELRYNQTPNRTTAVPWSVVTDAALDNTRSGSLNQRDTAPGASNWLVLGNSDQSPVLVESTATLMFGSDATTFNGSLSYGGVRWVKVADVTPADAGDDVTPGNSPWCPELRSNEYDAPEASLNVSLGSTERLTFTLDDVPDPAELDHAELTMWLHDADHPGQEGTVFVNDSGPLQLPADTAWNDISAEASLAIPVASLKAGHNVVQFGAGSLATTIYAVSRVALNVAGPACAPAPDASAPHDAGSDAWQPLDASSEAAADGASTGGSAGAAATGTGMATDDDGGCACTTREPKRTWMSAWCVFAVVSCVAWRRRRRARRERKAAGSQAGR